MAKNRFSGKVLSLLIGCIFSASLSLNTYATEIKTNSEAYSDLKKIMTANGKENEEFVKTIDLVIPQDYKDENYNIKVDKSKKTIDIFLPFTDEIDWDKENIIKMYASVVQELGDKVKNFKDFNYVGMNFLQDKEEIYRIENKKENKNPFETIITGYIEDKKIVDPSEWDFSNYADLNIAVTGRNLPKKKVYISDLTYDDLSRTPDKYKNKDIEISGKVVQVLEDGTRINLRIAIDGDYDQMVLVEYTSSLVEERILEDDYVNAYGKSIGIYTYTSSMNVPISVPALILDKIERVQ